MTRNNTVALLHACTGSKSISQVWADAVHLWALTIANTVHGKHWEQREARYLQIISTYTAEQQHNIAQALACVTLELEREPRDVLGEIYMSLGLGAKEQGQFFTPYAMCKLMAELTLAGDTLATAADGSLTIHEPACGAGGMLIAQAEALRARGINPQHQVRFSGEDISETAVHMAYTQLALLGLRAVVRHRNTLTQEDHGAPWETPWHTHNLQLLGAALAR